MRFLESLMRLLGAPMRFLRGHLSVKMSLRLVLVAIPLLAVAVWRATLDERAAATELLIDRGRVAAMAGAAAYGAILESGVDAGAFTLDDLIQPTYTEIAFPGIQVENRRYHTKYDAYTDSHGIQRIEDTILASSPDFLYASGMDIRGYVPTPHRKYAQLPTGDLGRDRLVSRGKRKYEETEPIQAAGYMGNDPTLVLDYRRDTGQLIWDIVAPITVRGKHWGGFRVGVVRDQVNVRTTALAMELGRVLAIAVLILAVMIFWSTSVAMRPLRELACAATRLSTTHDGAELGNPIRAASSDEVGQMARALERIRQSLLIAFRRS